MAWSQSLQHALQGCSRSSPPPCESHAMTAARPPDASPTRRHKLFAAVPPPTLAPRSAASPAAGGGGGSGSSSSIGLDARLRKAAEDAQRARARAQHAECEAARCREALRSLHGAVRVVARVGGGAAAEGGDAGNCLRLHSSTQLELCCDIRQACEQQTASWKNRRRSTGGLEELVPCAAEGAAAGPGELQRRFVFDQVLNAPVDEDEVYAAVQEELMSFMAGGTSCLIAYGAAGSGKTRTIEGIADRAAEALEQQLAQLAREGPEAEVALQMVEVYNEQVLDLLRATPVAAGCAGGSSNQRPVLHGVSSQCFRLGEGRGLAEHIKEVVQDAKASRAESLGAREGPSRSHVMYAMSILQADPETGLLQACGKLCLVDLAGNDRADRAETDAARLKDAQHVARSLAALTEVVVARGRRCTHVPYQSSKLTALLQDVFFSEAQTRTTIVVTLSRTSSALQQTLRTLNFAARIASLTAHASGAGPRASTAKSPMWKRIDEDAPLEEFDLDESKLEEDQEELSQLRAELEEMRAGVETATAELAECTGELRSRDARLLEAQQRAVALGRVEAQKLRLHQDIAEFNRRLMHVASSATSSVPALSGQSAKATTSCASGVSPPITQAAAFTGSLGKEELSVRRTSPLKVRKRSGSRFQTGSFKPVLGSGHSAGACSSDSRGTSSREQIPRWMAPHQSMTLSSPSLVASCRSTTAPRAGSPPPRAAAGAAGVAAASAALGARPPGPAAVRGSSPKAGPAAAVRESSPPDRLLRQQQQLQQQQQQQQARPTPQSRWRHAAGLRGSSASPPPSKAAAAGPDANEATTATMARSGIAGVVIASAAVPPPLCQIANKAAAGAQEMLHPAAASIPTPLRAAATAAAKHVALRDAAMAEDPNVIAAAAAVPAHGAKAVRRKRSTSNFADVQVGQPVGRAGSPKDSLRVAVPYDDSPTFRNRPTATLLGCWSPREVVRTQDLKVAMCDSLKLDLAQVLVQRAASFQVPPLGLQTARFGCAHAPPPTSARTPGTPRGRAPRRWWETASGAAEEASELPGSRRMLPHGLGAEAEASKAAWSVGRRRASPSTYVVEAITTKAARELSCNPSLLSESPRAQQGERPPSPPMLLLPCGASSVSSSASSKGSDDTEVVSVSSTETDICARLRRTLPLDAGGKVDQLSLTTASEVPASQTSELPAWATFLRPGDDVLARGPDGDGTFASPAAPSPIAHAPRGSPLSSSLRAELWPELSGALGGSSGTSAPAPLLAPRGILPRTMVRVSEGDAAGPQGIGLAWFSMPAPRQSPLPSHSVLTPLGVAWPP
mmetsp:Transcript_59539/g.194223  ORF Transcript_59539/g.194223 Transcript_59539/m.194223 type:complete len:1306 (+) Transcript_59539:49-3966(+)